MVACLLAHCWRSGKSLTKLYTFHLDLTVLYFETSQNATRMIGNETEYYMSVTTHPDLYYYQAIYGGFILVIILTSFLRSFAFMKVI